MKCELCKKNKSAGIAPSRGEFPEPVNVCKECGMELPNVENDGFPVFHFKSENGFWYFVFIHSKYLYPYFYPSFRPDIKQIHKDKVAREKKMRDQERSLCKRIIPYAYKKSTEEDILFFAYGDEIDRTLLKKLDVKFKPLEKAYLFGGKLEFSGETPEGTGKPGIAGAPDEEYVEGMVYVLRNEKELDKLDKYMNMEQYQLRKILVHLESGQPVMAMLYIASEYKDGLRPDKISMGHMIKGAKQNKLSQKWIDMLEKMKRENK